MNSSHIPPSDPEAYDRWNRTYVEHERLMLPWRIAGASLLISFALFMFLCSLSIMLYGNFP